MGARIFGIIGSPSTDALCYTPNCKGPSMFYFSGNGSRWCASCTIKNRVEELNVTKTAYDRALADVEAIREYFRDHPELGLEI